MNNLQVGRAARALRHRLALRQSDVADRAGLGHDLVSRVERGRIDGLTIRSLRRLFEVFEADVAVTVRWRGGELDRLVDRRHAAVAELAATRLRLLGWSVEPEVSFSEFGERGSIDLLAWHVRARALLVIEVKTELTSIEETIRRHDAKARLGAKIGAGRFAIESGASVVVARLLVLPDERTPRRRVAQFGELLGRAYPSRGAVARRWLRAPSGPFSGLIFVAATDDTRLRHRHAAVRRVARSRSRDEGGLRPPSARVIGG